MVATTRRMAQKSNTAGTLLLILLVIGLIRIFTSNNLTSTFTFPQDSFVFSTNFLDRRWIVGYDEQGGRIDSSDWWIGRISLDNSTPIVHQGAKHPNGSLGMILNPTTQRLRRPTAQSMMAKFKAMCPHPGTRYGIESEEGNLVLHKIKKGLEKAKRELQRQAKVRPPVKILCMIYTVYLDDDQHSSQSAIADTWGRDCDGFFGASNLTDHSIGTIDLPHVGPEDYDNMWQKIRSMWTYAYDHYLEDYDYFYIAGDDTFVLLDHMRLFLQGPQVQRLEEGYLDRISTYHSENSTKETANLRPRPLYFGNLMHNRGYPMIAGGPGYILNRAALRLWGEKGADSFRTKLYISSEDFCMAWFFISQGVFISETQDEANGWRFAGSGEKTSKFNGMNSWTKPNISRTKYGLVIPPYIDAVSEHQLSFHLKFDGPRLHRMKLDTRDLIYRYHAFFNGLCEADCST